MNVLIDTNILTRMAQPGHVQQRPALDASDALQQAGDVLCLVPQILYEFWVVATRPAAVNGLGLPVARVAAEVIRLKTIFPLLSDTPSIFGEWERLVTAHQVVGKHAHDARIVAAMTVHGITHLLTFNKQDFSRYSGITSLDPVAIAPPAAPNP